MNFNELIHNVAAHCGSTKAETGRVLRAYVEVCTDALSDGEKVSMRNFGTLYATERAACTVTNPRNGKEIQVPSRRYASFRSSSKLKARLNALKKV